MRLVVALAAFAGCATPPGLTLEVLPDDDSVTSVELIVGGPCDSCASVMAAPALSPRETSVFAAQHATVWRADVDQGVAGFVLHTDGSEEQTIPILIVVGFDAARHPVALATLEDVGVPPQQSAYWQTHLAPIDPLTDSATTLPDGTERAAVWRAADQTEPSCVMLETWEHGAATTTAVVPTTDPDCDHVDPRYDCAPTTPNATNIPPSLDDSTCLLPVAISAGSTTCMLGGPSCTDGVPPTTSTTCERLTTDYCVAGALCACAPADLGCLFDKLLNGTLTGEVTNLQCTVPITASGALCSGPTTVPLDASGLLVSGRVCQDLQILTGFLAGGTHAVDSLPFGTLATMSFGNFRTPCSIDISWMGTIDQPGGTRIDIQFADLLLDNAAHVVVPFRVDVVGDCTKPFSCKLVKSTNADTIALCEQ